jgi:penicillin-binding protein 2
MFGRDEKVSQIRLTAVQYGILVLFFVLAYGFWRLQVSRNDYYDAIAQQNRIRQVPILAPRGKILDREGRVIVDNYPSFSALLLRDQVKDLDKDVEKIAAGLHLDPEELRTRIKRMAGMPTYQPIFLKYDITPDELAFIESHRVEFPQLDTITVHRRLYPKGGFMAHLVGYVGEVSEDMLNQPAYELYNSGDVVGQSGVEKFYNDILMGKNGSRRVLVNSKGKEVGELSDEPAAPGKPLKLTIDIDLQIAAEQALDGRNGAIVAMDPRTGEILAMVSRPTFDPNAFSVRISRKEWNSLVTDPAKPLLNKAIQAQLAPGSVFKMIMSVAGWQEGISQNLQIHCGGGASFYGRFFKCHLKGGHGAVTLPKGIYQSCDVYFYTLAERLGIGRISQYATEFGLGQKTGIDLPQEVSGVMPSEKWKLRNFRQKWYAGETISVGIGQGAVATTPIQLARAISAISTDGRLVRPHVAFPDELPQYFREANNYGEVKKISFDEKGWTIITDAMADVVNPIGTAPSAHLKDIDFAGKTGSAQTISNQALAKISGDKSKYRDNGWFVGFTPRRNPDVVVAALVEHGEHGYIAARVVAQVVKAYVEKQRERQKGLQMANAPEVQKKADVGAVWHEPARAEGDQKDKLGTGRIEVPIEQRASRDAEAAPGIAPVSAPIAGGRRAQQGNELPTPKKPQAPTPPRVAERKPVETTEQQPQ